MTPLFWTTLYNIANRLPTPKPISESTSAINSLVGCYRLLYMHQRRLVLLSVKADAYFTIPRVWKAE